MEHKPANTVEKSFCIDINELVRVKKEHRNPQWNAMLEPPHRNHLINWRLGHSVFVVKIVPFGFRDHVEREIPLVRSVPNYGGERIWFQCPECGKKVNRLYLPPDAKEFACRECHHLRYRSQEKRNGRQGVVGGGVVTTRRPESGEVGLTVQSTVQAPQTSRLNLHGQVLN
jgi:hypothetical protein